MVKALSLKLACVGILVPFVLSSQSVPLPSFVQDQIESKQERQGKRHRSNRPAEFITLSVKDVTVRAAIIAMADSARMQVVYDDTDPVLSQRISLSVQKEPVEVAFTKALQGTGLVAKRAPDGETIVVRPLHNSGAVKGRRAENGGISGRVVDSASGKSMSGVTIIIPELKRSVMTDEKGTFVFGGIPAGEYVVSAKLFGYRAVSRAVVVVEGKTSNISIRVVATVTELSGVVTSVTGTQRKIEIGNDVTSIDVDSVMKTAPITSVTDLLDGRVPGLTVTRSSGLPGAPSRLRLRGIGGGLTPNLEGAPTNDPIVIVDGIRIYASQSGVGDQTLTQGKGQKGRGYSTDFPPPSPIDQIDVNAIERVDVYKGPSATAMYGSDAANGVIVVTTKKGAPGSARWTTTIDQSIEYLPGTYTQPGYYVFCSSNLLSGVDPPKICSWSDAQNSYVDSVARFQALSVPALTPFGRGSRGGRTVSVSGGQGQYMYSITGSIGEQTGVPRMPDLYQRQFRVLYDSAAPRWMRRPNLYGDRSLNASFSLEPRRGLTTRFVTRVSSSNTRQSSAQLQIPTLASSYVDTNSMAVAMVNAYATKAESQMKMVDLSMAMNWITLQSFPVAATVGTSRANRIDTNMNLLGYGFYSMGNSNTDVQTANVSGLLKVGKVSTAIGINVVNNIKETYQAKNDSLGLGIVVPSALTDAVQTRYRSATGGWFIEPRLNLNSRLFVNPGFRFDGNTLSGSKGGSNGLWDLFPKLNFSWVALERQSAEQAFGFISMLRPRLSFGVAGVQPGPGWQLRLLKSDRDDRSLEGLKVSTLGNTELHPERTREVEGGFDLELFDSRIRIAWTQFHKLRLDAIQSIGIAPSVYGEMVQYRNVGQIRNTGMDLSLGATILEPDSAVDGRCTYLHGSKYIDEIVR